MITVQLTVTKDRKTLISGTLSGSLEDLALVERLCRTAFDPARVHLSSPLASSVRPQPRPQPRTAKRALKSLAAKAAEDLKDEQLDLSRPDRFEPQ